VREAKDTGYQAVIWNEPLIMNLGFAGRKGVLVPDTSSRVKQTVGDVTATIPSNMIRKTPPKLPELSEPEIARHFIRLSQQNFGTDSGINIGVGTCTMKYNPKINEFLSRHEKLTYLHPFQDDETVQGLLEIMHHLNQWLCEISGMDQFSFQPRGGAHAVFANARIMKAYHENNGEEQKRDEIISTVLSHPCNAGSPAIAGYKVITLYPEKDTGIPSIEALKEVVSNRTAGLMITDPYDTGVFDRNIEEYIATIHDFGGLVAVDQANGNSILGRLRIGDIGADLCHFNLHKSFSTPHGSCGPGSAPIGARGDLVEFLPIPLVDYNGSKYFLNHDLPKSIGKIGNYFGVIPNIVRAYAWIMTMGAEGLLEASEVAVINNNYLIRKLVNIRGVTLPWYDTHPYRMQEARFSLEKMHEETGIGIGDFNRRVIDYGIQRLFTSHEPWIIGEPFTPEPPESSTLEDLDFFADVIAKVANEAYDSPEIFKDAPHNCSISRVDTSPALDSKKWAMTWRAYLKKHR
jgi:glycine dehydrogenase subunit 2